MATREHVFSRFAGTVSGWTGKPAAFILALATVIIWAVTGPIFDFSETWQLIINTGTTIITFLMVFILQNAQTRDTKAIQAKLDELILTSQAENRFIGIENLDEKDLEHLDELVAKAAQGNRDSGAEENSSGDVDGDGTSKIASTKTVKRRGKQTVEGKQRQAKRPLGATS